MAATFLAWGKVRTSVGASLTRQWPASMGHGLQLTGVDNIYTWGLAGTLSNLYQRLATNDRGASTLRMRKNGADATLALSIGASSGAAEFEDDVNSDAIANGDEVNLQLVTGAGGTTFIATVGTVKFTATVNSAIRVQTTDAATLSAASTTTFYPFGGRATTAGTVEGDTTVEIETACTLKYLAVQVASNTRSTNTEVGIRVNGADASLKNTVPGSTNGAFIDNATPQALVVGDDVCFFVRTGTGTGNFGTQAGIWVDLETTNDKWQAFAGTSGGDAEATFLASATHYLPIGGAVTNDYTTESEVQIKNQVAFVGSMLQARVSANTVAASSALVLRKGGADTALSATIPATTNGLFLDNSNSVSVAVDDLICYKLAVGAGGTSMNVSVTSMLCSTPSASSPIDFRAQRRRLVTMQLRARWQAPEDRTFPGIFAGPNQVLTGVNLPPSFPVSFSVVRRRLNLTKNKARRTAFDPRLELRAPHSQLRAQPFKELTNSAPPPPPNPAPLGLASRRMHIRDRRTGRDRR